MFNKILNWKLLSGSHDFPGPEGGTCINEAAMVAAGFKYKAVKSVDFDTPECFSRPIAQFAMILNDTLDDQNRQKLMKFVLCFAGSADCQEIEDERRDLIRRTLNSGLMDILYTMNEYYPLSSTIQKLRNMVIASDFYRAKADVVRMMLVLRADISTLQHYEDYSKGVRLLSFFNENLADLGCSILEKALSIGNQAKPEELDIVADRFENMKQAAKERAIV